MNEAEFEELKRRHPTYAKFYHWVRPSRELKEGYYRRRPPYDDVQARSRSQLESQIALGEAAYEAYGTRGSTKHNGILISNFALKIQEKMKGQHYRLPAWKRAIEDLRRALKKVEVVVEAREK